MSKCVPGLNVYLGNPLECTYDAQCLFYRLLNDSVFTSGTCVCIPGKASVEKKYIRVLGS